jgi:hypothetical protein
MMPRFKEDAKDVVRYAHGCEATFVTSVPVREEIAGQVIWDGDVDVFYLEGHPRTNCCFVLAHEEDSERFYTPVLAVPPIINPQAAVRQALSRNGPCG